MHLGSLSSNNPMKITVALLADHPEFFDDLCLAYEREWPQWYGVRGGARSELKERIRSEGLPIGLIALENGCVVGALAIAERGTLSHEHLSPWITGLWVAPLRRHRGIGAQLLNCACERARRMGATALYASTNTASAFFVRLGWVRFDLGTTQGGDEVEIFSLALT